MSRLRVFMAMVCLSLTATNHTNPKAEREQAQAQRAIASSLGNIATTYHQEAERTQRPNQEAEPCKPGDDRRYSDLCAQWKAADAAADSAWWAWVSGLVGLGSLVGVFVALGLALHSNLIARDTAKRELRAYLSSASVMIEEISFDSTQYVMNMTVANHGQTPAAISKISLSALWHFGDGGTEVIKVERDVRLKCHKDPPMNFSFQFDGIFEGCEKSGFFIIVGGIVYTDIFKNRDSEHFGWMMDAKEKAPFSFLNFPISLSSFSPEVIEEMIVRRQQACGEAD